MFTRLGPLDFVAIARETLAEWERDRVFPRLVAQNRGGPRFSFLDGPITANNPMGVHHARGRTYKDVFQRYKAMCGFDQRYQNGFDCQGLWVEVEVERALGLADKRAIEAMGLEAFARACRERVLRFAAMQTEQSRRLGQWMDWERSYYTMSDGNIAHIWHFLHRCHERGWIARGHRVMPWCTRCGTSISQHEMLESHAELTHQAMTVAFPIEGRDRGYLLAWTTTPWTLPANVALAVHPALPYEGVQVGDRRYYVAAAARARLPGLTDVRERITGAELVGLRYHGAFDDLPAQQGAEHRVVEWDQVAADEGTGIVHIAPGCGEEDFELGRRHGLAAIMPADEDGRYRGGFAGLEGTRLAEAAAPVEARLRAAGLLVRAAPHRHRYPTCWRCGEELIFRVVDEWFIRADEIRPRALAANAGVTWHPDHMRLRMNDWLQNMGDWCISRKRYWGLPLPFYPCAACGKLTVVGDLAELRALAVDPAAVDALPELHRPWIDAVAIRCPGCGASVARVPEVGDCWLDAGIVPFSTLPYLEDREAWARWFPADLVVEMAAQIRGWFYALLFMSVALEDRAPYRVVIAHDKVLGEDGREMHKSWGNAVWLDEALDRMGPDAVRYLFAAHPVADPLRFGPAAAREVTRRFLTLWNSVALFVTYANLDRPALSADAAAPDDADGLEAWILSRLQGTVRAVRDALDGYQLRRALAAVEDFVQDDLSNWYVRRRRRLFWKGEMTAQKAAAYRTLHHVLVRVAQLLAPVTPFVADRIYRTLVDTAAGNVPSSVHLTRFPEPDPAREMPALEAGVAQARRALRLGLAVRNAAGVPVRQPLARAIVRGPAAADAWLRRFTSDLADELNVEAVEYAAGDGAEPDAIASAHDAPGGSSVAGAADPGRRGGRASRQRADHEDGTRSASEGDLAVALDLRLTEALRLKGRVRQLVHHVQLLRKAAGLEVDDRIRLALAAAPETLAAFQEHRALICGETLAVELSFDGPEPGFTTREARLDGAAVILGLVRADAGRPL